MKPERIVALRQQALKSVAARASNPRAPGVSMVAVSPHEVLEMLDALEASAARVETEDDQQ